MKRILLISTVACLLLSSCASLTKSQVETVHQFAYTSRNFSAYPSKIMTALADIRVKRGLFYVNSLENSDEMDASNESAIDSLKEVSVQQHVQELDDIYTARKKDYNLSRKVDITFIIIDKYAQSLLLLSSDKHAAHAAEQAGVLGVSLDSLVNTYNAIPGAKQVPAGTGGLVGSLVMAGGKQLIRSKQAHEIKRFVPAADEMIAVMTGNLLDFLESGSIATLIANEETGIRSNYKSFLRQRNPQLQDERNYLQLKTDLDYVKILRRQTIAATKNLRKAHGALLAALSEKKTIPEEIAELQSLYEDVKQVKATITALDTDKQ